jgi:hypothetical protein
MISTACKERDDPLERAVVDISTLDELVRDEAARGVQTEGELNGCAIISLRCRIGAALRDARSV